VVVEPQVAAILMGVDAAVQQRLHLLAAVLVDAGQVDVVLKNIKNVHLSVCPPTGRVRISAPERMKIDTIRVFAISKLN
jgi:hypothetical protein